MVIGVGGKYSDKSTLQIQINDNGRIDPQGNDFSVCVLFLSHYPSFVFLLYFHFSQELDFLPAFTHGIIGMRWFFMGMAELFSITLKFDTSFL